MCKQGQKDNLPIHGRYFILLDCHSSFSSFLGIIQVLLENEIKTNVLLSQY